MSTTEDLDGVAEHPLGWLRVWVFALAGMAIPTWMLATAVYIQLSPALNGAEAGMTPAEVPWIWWIWAAWDVGCSLLWVLPVGALLLIGVRFAQLALDGRTQAQRARMAEEIQADAVIEDADWQEPQA